MTLYAGIYLSCEGIPMSTHQLSILYYFFGATSCLRYVSI